MSLSLSSFATASSTSKSSFARTLELLFFSSSSFFSLAFASRSPFVEGNVDEWYPFIFPSSAAAAAAAPSLPLMYTSCPSCPPPLFPPSPPPPWPFMESRILFLLALFLDPNGQSGVFSSLDFSPPLFVPGILHCPPPPFLQQHLRLKKALSPRGAGLLGLLAPRSSAKAILALMYASIAESRSFWDVGSGFAHPFQRKK
mmetsp:Transcript_6560/g.12800  ORF Transcript_6560/g.12800 Transcript_6560/m.12800 type:complete len:200 (+) Transcript_6560:1137-1736(+)